MKSGTGLKNLKIFVPAIMVCAFALCLGLAGTAWAGYTTTQLTNNDYNDYAPQINASGQVVWASQHVSGCCPTISEDGVFLYSAGVTTKLSSSGSGVQINDSGQVVWQASDGTDSEIFLYSGGVTTQLTNNDFDDTAPQINNSGQVAWSAYHYECCPGLIDDGVYLYSAGVTTMISPSGSSVQINDNGQMVWQVWDGDGGRDWEIFLYSGGVTTQLTNNDFYDIEPQISASGKVVWSTQDYSGDGMNEDGVFLYDAGVTTQIHPVGNSARVNDSGQMVWQVWDGDGEIFMATLSSPQELIQDCVSTVKNLQIDSGVRTSLLQKVENAQSSLQKGDKTAAANMLKALLNEIKSQRSKKIDNGVADELTVKVTAIINSLSGP